MSRPAPVYFVYYNRNTVGVYTQAFRALALIKYLLVSDPDFSDKSLFSVIRCGLAKGSQFKLNICDVTSSFVKFV